MKRFLPRSAFRRAAHAPRETSTWLRPTVRPHERVFQLALAVFLVSFVVGGVLFFTSGKKSPAYLAIPKIEYPLSLFAQAHWQAMRDGFPDALLAGYTDDVRVTVIFENGTTQDAEGIVAARDLWFGASAASRKRAGQGLSGSFRNAQMTQENVVIRENEQTAEAVLRLVRNDGSILQWRDMLEFHNSRILQERLEATLFPATLEVVPKTP